MRRLNKGISGAVYHAYLALHAPALHGFSLTGSKGILHDLGVQDESKNPATCRTLSGDPGTEGVLASLGGAGGGGV